jgi:hypothetical protein
LKDVIVDLVSRLEVRDLGGSFEDEQAKPFLNGNCASAILNFVNLRFGPAFAAEQRTQDRAPAENSRICQVEGVMVSVTIVTVRIVG